jgi:outer membrane protein assembly factor BamB
MRLPFGLFLTMLLSVSVGEPSIAATSPPPLLKGDQPAETEAHSIPALQGQVNVLEKLEKEVTQSKKSDRPPLLNGVAVSDAIPVELPQQDSASERRNFSLGAKDDGWIFYSKGLRIQTPAYADGAIFVVGGGYGLLKTGIRVFALKARTGEKLWQFQGGGGWPSEIVAEQGVCAFTVHSCSEVVLDTKTGVLKWRKWLAPEVITNLQPAIKGNYIYLAFLKEGILGAQPVLSCRTQENGHLVWQSKLPGYAVSTPVVDNDRIYLTTSSSTPHYAVECFDAKTGSLLWEKSMGAGSTPLGLKGNVFVSDSSLTAELLDRCEAYRPDPNGGNIIRVSGTTIEADEVTSGRTLWRTSLDEDICKGRVFGPFIGKSNIYLITSSGYIVSLNSKTGNKEICYATQQQFDCQPCLAEGNLYAVTADGKLICFPIGDAASGRNCWKGNAQHNL